MPRTDRDSKPPAASLGKISALSSRNCRFSCAGIGRKSKYWLTHSENEQSGMATACSRFRSALISRLGPSSEAIYGRPVAVRSQLSFSEPYRPSRQQTGPVRPSVLFDHQTQFGAVLLRLMPTPVWRLHPLRGQLDGEFGPEARQRKASNRFPGGALGRSLLAPPLILRVTRNSRPAANGAAG